MTQSEFSAVSNKVSKACKNVMSVDYLWLGFYIDTGNACSASAFISAGTCEPATAAQLNWASSQPDGNGAEMCVMQGASTAGGNKLHDTTCDQVLPFACQIYAKPYADICTDAAAAGTCPVVSR